MCTVACMWPYVNATCKNLCIDKDHCMNMDLFECVLLPACGLM